MIDLARWFTTLRETRQRTEHLRRGRLGERAARAHLRRIGMKFLTANFRGRGEADLVFRDTNVLVFVEVKARQDHSFGEPEEAVTAQKQGKIVWMATDYLTRNGLGDVPCRFDVVAISTETEPPTVTVLVDAFRPGW